jgi:hypothetical protein
MNATISRRFSKGCRSNNEPIQIGFGVRPTSFRWSTSPSVSPRRNSVHNKRLRRLSTGHTEYLMMNHKPKPMFIFDTDEDNVAVMNKNDSHPIKRPSCTAAVNLNLDDFMDVDKPKRKQNKGAISGTDTCLTVGPIVVDDETTVVSNDSSSFNSCDNNSNCISSCDSALEPSTPKRKVRFPIDNDGKVQCQEYYLSEKDAEMLRQCSKHDLWWTKKDRLASRDAARERIQQIPELFPAYQAATIQLLTKFGGIDTSGDMILPPKLLSWYAEQPRSDSYAIHIIARSSDTSRGLEKMLYRVIGIPPPKYRNSVKRVIATQNELKSSDCCTPNLIMDVLATQYIHDALGAVAMARLLAESDVIAAQRTETAMLHV